MRSRLRRRLARGIVVLPLALAGCSGMQQAFYESDPAAYDFPNFHAALDAQSRGDDAAAARAYQRLYDNTKHPIAEVQLGRRYAEGQGVPKDTAKALQLLQSAYDKDWSGRAEAAYYLGRMYDDGNGVPEDKQKAFELFDYAWSKGVKQAAYPLARAYDEGVPVKADRSRALELYRAAAKNGDARAHLRLAELEAEDGAPKEQVYDEAAPGVAWLRGLAKEDNDWAEGRLATIYEEGKVAPPDPELADRYLHDAAQHGNASANVKLAEREEQGGDPKKAMTYWRAAAEEGHPSGMVRTGFDAIDGGRTREGLSWLERAAALGHPSAMAEIGRRQLSGDGEPKDPAAGLAMLEKAAAMGHPSAMYALGQAYEDGNGVPKDKGKAREWFEKAQAAGHPNAAKALAQLASSS